MNFIKKHPIITNLVLVIIVSLLLVWGVLSWLKVYTKHDKTVIIPTEIIGMPIEDAKKLLTQHNLGYEETKPVYVKNSVPGTVCRVWPPQGNNVKQGRVISITTYSNEPPEISLPEIKDMSQRQALALLRSVGFENVKVKMVDGPYRDLVVGLENDGRPVYTGVRYHNNIPLTLLVSAGNSLPEDSIEIPQSVPETLNDTPDESWF